MIQQIIRSPQGPVEIVNQPIQSQIVTNSINQGSRVNQLNQQEQVFYSNPPVVSNMIPVQLVQSVQPVQPVQNEVTI